MAKTIEEGFEKFIGWLKPLSSEHKKSTAHKDSVFRCMVNNWGCKSMFETGSFGNGTGVLHYSDTDYFARCRKEHLSSNSAITLRNVKKTLQATFPRTPGIEVKSPSVRIPFGNYASERLELTPVFYAGNISTPLGKKHSYYLPDYTGGWMLSSPNAHNAYVNHQDKRLRGKLKPLIQMVKAWKFYNNAPIASFYLELRVTKYAESRTSIVYEKDIKHILKQLTDNGLASIQDPMGISGCIKACKTNAKKINALSKLNTGYGRTLKAWEARATNIDDVFYWWKMFYNSRFPSR